MGVLHVRCFGLDKQKYNLEKFLICLSLLSFHICPPPFEGKAEGHFFLRNPGRDISFPIFTRKEVETKRIGKEIKTIISRINDLSSFLSNIEQNRN